MHHIVKMIALSGAFLCLSCGSDPDGVATHADRPDNGSGGAAGTGAGGTSNGGGSSTPGGGGTGSGSGQNVCSPKTEDSPCETRPPQCGCDEGKSCEANRGDGGTTCFTSLNAQLNDACTSFGDCAPGFTCVARVCKQYCYEKADCPGDDGVQCIQFQVDQALGCNDVPGAKVCTNHCIPWIADSCGSELRCYPYSPVGERPGTWQCLPPTANVGSGCSTPNKCGSGYASQLRDECFKWCRIDAAGDCGPGVTCLTYTDGSATGLFWGITPIGYCAP